MFFVLLPLIIRSPMSAIHLQSFLKAIKLYAVKLQVAINPLFSHSTYILSSFIYMINVQLRCNAHRCSPGMSRHSRQACDVISSSSQSVFIRTAQLSVACVSGVKQAVEICPWKQKRGIRVVSLFSFISKGKLSDWRITPDSGNSEFCFFFCVKVSSWNFTCTLVKMLKTGQNVHCLMSRCCHIRQEHRKKLKCVNDVEELKDKLKKTNKQTSSPIWTV